MNLVRIGSLCLLLLCTACAKEEVVYKTQIQEVKVPIAMTINRPPRPSYLLTDTIPGYTLKVVEYAEILEMLIDENNKLVTNEVINERND